MIKQLCLIVLLFITTALELNAQTWNQKANVPTIARHRATSFSIGNKGYVCLGHINTVANILFEDLWEYNPASNTWTQKADFGGGLRYHAHGFVINGKAYVGTGRDASSYQDDNWEYDPTTNTWIQKSDIPGPNRRGTVSFVINDIGYVGSGLTSSGGSSTSNDFYAYDPTIDNWTEVASFPGQSRNSAVGFAIGSKGYMGTGDTGGYSASKDFWEYDSALDVWTQKANVGDSIRRHATGFALNGRGYIGSGHNTNIDDDMDDFWEYNPALDTWVQIEDFLGISRRYMTSFVIANRAYTSMGTNGINFNDLWEYNPSYIVALPPSFDDVDVAVTELSNHSFEIDISDLPNNLQETFVVINNKEGVMIEKLTLPAGAQSIQSSQIPENCTFRLVLDGIVTKSGKLK
ncbi:MAG: hypothetical protein MK105_08410 [Crocinitomicaceae bacterium]|nr:hypothetical protein [Crocinitomicaceae bacterium]